MILTYLLILLGGMLIVSAVSHILYQKRSPSSMISWLVSILFLPYIAVPFYFIVGIRKRETGRKKGFVTFPKVAALTPYALEDSRHMLQNILLKNGMPPATAGNSCELITGDTEAYRRVLREIGAARRSIEISTYIFQFDEATETILDALTERAEEGVSVKLLMDLVGSLDANFNQKGFEALRSAGGEVAFFTPVPKRLFQNYINLRNHRKICIFDQKTVLSGGLNFSNAYMGKADGTQRWEDLLYALRGPAVYYFYHIFYNDWFYTLNEKKPIMPPAVEPCIEESVVQVVPSGPDIPTDALYESLLNAIYNAQERIWIVTPYFIPDENIMQALVIAYRKGVDVKLITPQDSDHLFVDMVRSPYMRELDETGVDVVLYKGEMLHAKAILFDSIGSMVGSVNLDNRSLFLNYEVVSFVYSTHFIKHLEVWMKRLIDHSVRGVEHPSKLREVAENMMKVFAPVL